MEHDELDPGGGVGWRQWSSTCPGQSQHPLFTEQAAGSPDDQLWYYWRLEHWGTKSQPGEFHFEGDDVVEGEPEAVTLYGGEAEVTVSFTTPWSPPLPVILAMSEKFPTLEFDLRYFEGGCGFNGMYRCKGGVVEADETGAYFGTRGG